MASVPDLLFSLSNCTKHLHSIVPSVCLDLVWLASTHYSWNYFPAFIADYFQLELPWILLYSFIHLFSFNNNFFVVFSSVELSRANIGVHGQWNFSFHLFNWTRFYFSFHPFLFTISRLFKEPFLFMVNIFHSFFPSPFRLLFHCSALFSWLGWLLLLLLYWGVWHNVPQFIVCQCSYLVFISSFSFGPFLPGYISAAIIFLITLGLLCRFLV